MIQRHSEFWEEKSWERFCSLQFRAAVACESAEIFSTCFPATCFLAALQSLTFSDCCPQLSSALCLIDKTARKKPSYLFLSAVAWPRSGLRRRIQSALTGAVCREFITCCESPTQAAREKNIFFFFFFCLLLAFVAVVRQEKQGIL